MSGKEEKIERYDISLEIIKIIACYFVVFNHTTSHGFLLFATRNVGE